MKKVTLDSGLELEVDVEAMADMEVVDALSELDEGNTLAVSKVLKKILTKEEKQKLYDFYRKDGKVPPIDVVNAFAEMLQKLPEGKN